VRRVGVGRHYFREPEIEELYAGLGQQNVLRLEIAMNDALAMRGLERIGDLERVLPGDPANDRSRYGSKKHVEAAG
jgi:hypothetical protein